MKSIYSKILALILVLSSLISMVTVFVTAEEAGSTEGETGSTEDKLFDLIATVETKILKRSVGLVYTKA